MGRGRVQPRGFEQPGNAVAEAHGGECGREEPDQGQAQLAHGEEAARVVEQAADAPGTRVPLFDQLLHAAVADRHQGDLGRDEERLERGEEDEEQDLADGQGHEASPPAGGAAGGAGGRLGGRLGGLLPVHRRERAGLADARRDADRQHAGRHVPRDDGAGARLRPVAQRHRRPEHRVHAQEHALSDRGAVLADAVVVRGDRAGADVRLGPHVGVAQVAHVVLADVLPEPAVLDLGVVADLRATADLRARPQVRERADRDLVLHHGSLDDAGPDDAVRADHRIDHLGPGADPRPLPHPRLPAEGHVGLQDHVRGELHGVVQVRGGRVHHRHPGSHPAVVELDPKIPLAREPAGPGR